MNEVKKNSSSQRAANINRALTPRRSPSPSSEERVGVRGRTDDPQYGKYRTRTTASRNFARRLRTKSTDAEKKLWRLLRDRRFTEFKFRRQYPCGIYYIDFFCTIAKLAIELDGSGHGFPAQRARDEKRNRFLAEQGIKVLRFWNHQLRGELEAMRFEIWHVLMERTGRMEEISSYLPRVAPSPQPSPPMGAREARPSTAMVRMERNRIAYGTKEVKRSTSIGRTKRKEKTSGYSNVAPSPPMGAREVRLSTAMVRSSSLS